MYKCLMRLKEGIRAPIELELHVVVSYPTLMMTVFCRTVTLLATEPSPVPRPSIFKCSLSTGTRLGTL